MRLDLWYGSIYEFALSDIDLSDYAEMSELFQDHVTLLQERCTNNANTVTKITKKAFASMMEISAQHFQMSHLSEKTLTSLRKTI